MYLGGLQILQAASVRRCRTAIAHRHRFDDLVICGNVISGSQ